MKKKFVASLAVILFISVFIGVVNASNITFRDFSDPSDLTLNEDAMIYNNVLRLTSSNSTWQAGSAFLTDTVDLVSTASFSSSFQFQITDSKGALDKADRVYGADGLCFVLQSRANTALGDAGGNIGYSNIFPSVGIEFDTYRNTGENDGNHVAVNLNGNNDSDSVASYNVPTPLNNGNVWHVWVDYDGTTDLMEIRLSETSLRPTDAQLSYTLDLLSNIDASNIYAGFTSGTGGGYGNHDILSWQFTSVPIPGAIWLFGSGILVIVSTRFKRKNS